MVLVCILIQTDCKREKERERQREREGGKEGERKGNKLNKRQLGNVECQLSTG